MVSLLASCSKENLTQNSLNENNSTESITEEKDGKGIDEVLTREKGYLVFESEEDIEKFISKLTNQEADPTRIDAKFGFESYLNNVPQTRVNEGIFGDEYFAGSLNKHGMVGIGNHVFKMNPATEEVFVADKKISDKDLRQLQQAQTSSDLPKEGMAFSFSDNVFDILAGRDSKTTCRFGAENIRQNASYCSFGNGNTTNANGEFVLRARYWRGGIWNTLKVELYHDCTGHFIQVVNV